MKRYPKVLIVTKSQIGDIDSAGAALRGWFGDWPRDHLAQVYSGVPAGGKLFCERNLQLGPEERRLGRVFSWLKESGLGDGALPFRKAAATAGTRRQGFLARVKRAVGLILIESGLWELVFSPRLSSRLRNFIEDFKPDVLFAQGCDITFMRLPLLIEAYYGTPVHFDVVDDWVTHLYRRSILGPTMNSVVARTFQRLARVSARRYCIGHLMAEEYRSRFGMDFTPLLQCDNPERFAAARSRYRTESLKCTEIVYSGSLALRRWEALLDLADACERARASGRNVSIIAYVPFVPPEAVDALGAAHCLELRPAVPDAEVPRILSGADILFLPESFDPSMREFIRLSVSTKCHLYMMSGRPSLVYGPPGIGTVEYARNQGWGMVVDQRGPQGLKRAIEALQDDPAAVGKLLAEARNVAAAHHSAPIVREELRLSLLGAIPKVT